jgi:hypothetical protein
MPNLSDIYAAGAMQRQPQMLPEAPVNEIEQKLYQRLMREYPQMVAEYATLKGTEGGKLLNTDIARELSEDYRADRTRASDVHEPSSQFIKKVFAQKLAQGDGGDVLFTAGGAGAGKSTALEALKDHPSVKNASVIYDTNMAKLDSSKKKIEETLKANKKATVIYTYRDPVDAFVNGALQRATNMEKELGTGRTVPLTEFLKTHIGALDTIKQLGKEYKGNDKVQIRVVDNSRGKGKAKAIKLSELPTINASKVRKELENALEREYAAGRISKAIYLGTKGK